MLYELIGKIIRPSRNSLYRSTFAGHLTASFMLCQGGCLGNAGVHHTSAHMRWWVQQINFLISSVFATTNPSRIQYRRQLERTWLHRKHVLRVVTVDLQSTVRYLHSCCAWTSGTLSCSQCCGLLSLSHSRTWCFRLLFLEESRRRIRLETK